MLPIINGEFGIVKEPEIKFSDNGKAWLKLRGVAKDRVRDANGAYSDGDPLYIDILINQGAEHLFESVAKGDSVIVVGKLKQREYESQGEKKTVFQINADSVGVSTRFSTAKTQRALDSGNPVQAAVSGLGAQEISPPPF